jgi:protein tyrosine phosphatase (PTP) superfamily phosphohydrolase (DUF442 family)
MFLQSLFLTSTLLFGQDGAAPPMEEVRAGVYVLHGVPTAGTLADMKRLRITALIDLRSDDEVRYGSADENVGAQEAGATYMRYAITPAPPAGDFDFLRAVLRDLPRTQRVLLHCSDGNRAAAVVCVWLALDRRMDLEEALGLCRKAGLDKAVTEEAVRKYVAGRR